jgi:hypothetical protein
MRTGIGIGIQGSTPKASDPPVQAFQGKSDGAGADPDITIIIEADADMQGGRLNSDGNHYTITIPEDYIGATDLFASARDGAGKIGSAVGETANLNVILNVPATMRIGANTANNIVVPQSRAHWHGYENPTTQVVADPCIVLNFNTGDWDESIFSRLVMTINNYGIILGAGGTGGIGGQIRTGAKAPFNYISGDGGGSGQGIHPAWGTTSLDDYYDINDTSAIWPAGQAGTAYGRGRAGVTAWGANGAHGTSESGGDGGTSANPDTGESSPQAGNPPAKWAHNGGTVIYLKSNVESVIAGPHIEIYNGSSGWMSSGAGGGGGSWGTGDGGDGGQYNRTYDGVWVTAGTGQNTTAWGQQGFGVWAGIGGINGLVFWNHDGNNSNGESNLTTSYVITNDSSNTIIGWDGQWAPA